MNNRKDFSDYATRYLWITVVFTVLAVALCCFASVFSSFGYKQSLRAAAIGADVRQSGERITVIIDAGHGGRDSGAVANGLVEKDLNLIIAKKLAAFLSLSDVDVIMTRSDDVLLGDGKSGSFKHADLVARTEIAKNTENCIFVSIHMNKFPLEYCRGMQVFYSPNDPLSKTLALSLHDASVVADSANDRVIKKAGANIFVLANIDSPAVLVECGFISNPTDAKILSDDVGQSRIAFTVFCGINHYLEQTKIEGDTLEG